MAISLQAAAACSTVSQLPGNANPSSSSSRNSSAVVSWLCPSSKFSTELHLSSLSLSSSAQLNPTLASQVSKEKVPAATRGALGIGEGSFDNVQKETNLLQKIGDSVKKGVVSAAVVATVALAQFPVAPAAAASAEPVYSELGVLISGPPIKDANALLRYALPVSNKPIKEIQKTLEGITEALKLPGVKAIDPVERDVRQASRLFNQNKDTILADVAVSKKEEAQTVMAKLSNSLLEFQDLLAQKDRAGILPKQKEALEYVGDIEEAMVESFPFEVPAEYAKMPLLKGRAKVEMKVRVKDNPNLRNTVFEMTVDGYNAPVTAGNFIDLVERRFYDNMEIQRADGFVVQTGDPDGPAEGFVDPETGKIRTIPLEIMVEGDKEPIYGGTLEELGRFREQTKLPFNAFGTLAMAREEFEPDSASSQIFWLLKESELTPSNANILDGTYAVFGYVTENQDFLADLKVGDVIESIRVTSGLDNLVNPSYKVGGA
ncbi:hypothetical protein R1flu_019898 [Riccia fluitans]|uniref:peptidylprolyl isomerase n=1 Tax=Riccia fluitans TaxID=41844 RepID=A0ABD1ZLD9_9MARC